MKERLDKLITDKNIIESREKAKALIITGHIFVEGERITKPGARVEITADIQVRVSNRGYVSRGGVKLEGALKDFSLVVNGAYCLDIGASTGGFTDCLLRKGACHVIALDVGKNQLDYRLRTDSHVTVVEKFNARFIDTFDFERVPDIVSIDVSFISIECIVRPLRKVIGGCTNVVALVKPQFELINPPKGFKGVVREKSVHCAVLRRLTHSFYDAGYEVAGYTFSRIRGPKGNIEYFSLLKPMRQEVVHTEENRLKIVEDVVRRSHEYFMNREQEGMTG
jgi:23S rRNA (cytidine1920-2'-O)/16S rRNA (cytidine1409-2'-O)-methyltransferase